jgi:hypothetical protein
MAEAAQERPGDHAGAVQGGGAMDQQPLAVMNELRQLRDHHNRFLARTSLGRAAVGQRQPGPAQAGGAHGLANLLRALALRKQRHHATGRQCGNLPQPGTATHMETAAIDLHPLHEQRVDPTAITRNYSFANDYSFRL